MYTLLNHLEEFQKAKAWQKFALIYSNLRRPEMVRNWSEIIKISCSISGCYAWMMDVCLIILEFYPLRYYATFNF